MLSLKEVYAKQGTTTEAHVLLVRPSLIKETQPEAIRAQHCCNLSPSLCRAFLILNLLASVRWADVLEQNRSQTCALPALFSLTKSVMSLPSSQPCQWAAAQAPQTCAT